MTDARNVAEAAASTPPARLTPHGLPTAPVTGLAGLSAAELRAQAEAAETRERAEAEARAAREAEYERLHREADRIAAETMPVYDAIAATVDSLLPGLGPLARQLEDAEAAAMAQGNAVDPEQGAAEVQGRLRRHRAERLRRFLDLLRDDGPARDQ